MTSQHHLPAPDPDAIEDVADRLRNIAGYDPGDDALPMHDEAPGARPEDVVWRPAEDLARELLDLAAAAASRPYEASFEAARVSESPTEVANVVTVRAVSRYEARHLRLGEHPDAAASSVADDHDRQLIRVDTNYTPTRPGFNPTDLARADAACLAAAVLEAIDDTLSRGGELGATEAAELLCTLAAVDVALARLRGHALGDLLRRAGLEPSLAEPGDQPAAPDDPAGSDAP